MYDYISGRLEEVSPTDAIVEAYGIGYDLFITLNTFSKIQNARGQNLKLYTHYVTREDGDTLYGFADKEERAVFVLLISVSGVGPGSARMILSEMTPEEVKMAILEKDVRKFKAVKGIGLKTAERIIVDLKDKVGKGDGSSLDFGSSAGTAALREEAIGALTMLGFSKSSVEKALDNLLGSGTDMTLETLIRSALKVL